MTISEPRGDSPLDDFATWVYLEEITHQVAHVLYAAKALKKALRSMRRKGNEEVYFALHSLLAAAGNISKLLWPREGGGTGKAAEQRRRRGVAVRHLLRATSESVLRSRELRNHIEHYDERLDAFVASGVQNRLDRVVTTKEKIKALGLATTPDRLFNPKTGVFSYREDDVDVWAVQQEAERIGVAAEAVLEDLRRR